ncbi:alpha/beta hydrolase [Pseudanabaena sp. FACHB-2040]|uniref:alpha/beta fold hydrolase n=1 Tax=Pseudanabaena sp. FACHB-2040 TaxID=2692859 RepID=UPI001688C5A3|nr:alpha/beta hydrolase [Pseudanabaena sp. FACHB-2040]MBD2258513.1 alpha/beta hydrolase [Pseudanabaena sp. FACHB-2040]
MLKPIKPLHLISPGPVNRNHPLLVFLPGMDGTGTLYVNQTQRLRQYFDIRCLVIPADDQTPWEGLVQQTVKLIKQDRQGRPVYLCAESFGACLALQVVAHAPDLIDRLILINPASSFGRLPWFRWVASVAPWVSASAYHMGTLTLLPLLAALHRISDDNRSKLLTAMRSVSQRSAAWRMALLSQFRVEDLPLHTFRNPTLFIVGQADRLLPSLSEAKRLAEFLPGSQTHLLPLSGHACLLEQEVDLVTILQSTDMLPEVVTSAA